MAFTMSYGVTPPPARIEPLPKARAPKKATSHRGRTHSNLQVQAEALFDPALAQPAEAPPPAAAMDVAEDTANRN